MTKAKFRTERTFEDTQNFSKEPRADDIVDVLKLPDGEWLSTRAVGPVVSVGGHWVQVEPPVKDKKTKAFWAPCLAFDPKTEERDSTKTCPWCADSTGWVRSALDYWQNFIVRSLEEDKPAKEKEHSKKERKTGFKEKGTKSWTPVRAMRIPPGFMRDMKKASSLNRHLNKKTGQKKAYPLSHEKCGVDLELQYDSSASAAKMYSLSKGEKRTPLNEEQQEYLLQPIELLSKVMALQAKAEDTGEDLEKILKIELKKQVTEYEGWFKRQKAKWKGKFGGAEGSEDDEDDEDEDDDKPKGKKGKKSSGKKSRDEDEDDDDSDDEDDDNEFSSDKKKSKKSKKSKDDDDDEDEDSDDEDDDDDEDEDDEPKSKKSKKSSKKGKKSKRSRDDEDDDEDEDDDDEDDDDD